jgi:CBS domain-containing protein
MKARDLMTPHAQAVTPADPLSHAAALMRDSNLGFLAVVEDRDSRQLVGVITDRDITIRHVANAHGDECRVGQHMTADDLATIAPDAAVGDVHELMSTRQVRRIPVVDTEGRILGVIAQADVAVKEDRASDIAHVVAEISEPVERHR